MQFYFNTPTTTGGGVHDKQYKILARHLPATTHNYVGNVSHDYETYMSREQRSFVSLIISFVMNVVVYSTQQYLTQKTTHGTGEGTAPPAPPTGVSKQSTMNINNYF